MDRAGQNKTTTHGVRSRRAALLLVVACAGSIAPSTSRIYAQEPAAHTDGTPEGVRTPADMRRDSEPARAVAPTSPIGPGGIGGAGQGWGSTGSIPNGPAAARPGVVPTPPLMAENTFVSSAGGRLVIGGTGERYFVFDRDAKGRRLPAVVLMPNLNLGALERLADRQNDGSHLLVTGQIYAYRGRNYMLISAPPILEREQTTSAPATQPPSSSAPAPSDGASTPPVDNAAGVDNDPSIESIVADLERHAGPARQTDSGGNAPAQPAAGGATGDHPGAGAAGGAEGAESALWASALSPVRPGQTLVMRRGRLVRGSAGSWRFVLDAGPENLGETPLTVLPCLNLQAMESLAERQGEAGVFSISGPVHSYQGVNYLLPRLYRVETVSTNLAPVQ